MDGSTAIIENVDEIVAMILNGEFTEEMAEDILASI